MSTATIDSLTPSSLLPLDALQKAIRANTPLWNQLQEKALHALALNGLPNAKQDERWKYSPLQRIWCSNYLSPAISPTAKTIPLTLKQQLPQTLPSAEHRTDRTDRSTRAERTKPQFKEPHFTTPSHVSSLTLDIVNGTLSNSSRSALKQVPGLTICTLSELSETEQAALLAQNEAGLAALYQQDGLCAVNILQTQSPIIITVSEGYDASQILQITHHRSKSADAIYTLLLVRVYAHQSITFVEQHVEHPSEHLLRTPEKVPLEPHHPAENLQETSSTIQNTPTHQSPNEQPGLTANLCLVDLADSAQLNHLRLLVGSNTHHQVTYARLNQRTNSQYNGACFSFGSGFIRAVTEPQLIEPNACARVNGAFITLNHGHHDHRIFIDHRVPHCNSKALYKGIAGKSATAVFNGRIHIAKGAKQSSGILQNRNLLLDNSASINTKPELEIHNDDVQCSHGATISQLDPLHVLYLRSRGLCQADAVNMLLESFLLESLHDLPPVFTAEENGLSLWLSNQLHRYVPNTTKGDQHASI